MDTKTPEQLAEHHANLRCPEQGPEFIVWCMCRDDFLAGFKAGREITDQEIVDILVDIREREAKERNKLPPLQQERHDRIWDRIKVKLVGIF